MPSSREKTLRQFSEQHELQTHSGIYPCGAISSAPTLNIRGEYTDPVISDAALEDYAYVAALGPLRKHENDIAKEMFSEDPGAENHPEIGWYVNLYTGHVTDTVARMSSSSGGLATALLLELLRTGKITGVIHMKPSSGDALFQYGISRTVDDVAAGSRTRYYPGSLFEVLEQVRQTDGRYAVVGIPPFISELRRLEDIEPVLKERILYHLGLVCAHQKTANYATYLAWQAGIEPGKLTSIDFRTKVEGHPANEYCTTFYFEDADGRIQEKMLPQPELRGTNWGHGMFKSYFYDFNDDAFNETADVVFGDAWLPEFTEDYRGTNIVIVRNRDVDDILSSMEKQGSIRLDEVNDADIVNSQQSLIRHSRDEMRYRRKILSVLRQPVPERYRTLPNPKSVSVARKCIQWERLLISGTSHRNFEDALRQRSLRVFELRMKPMEIVYYLTDKANRLVKKILRMGRRK